MYRILEFQKKNLYLVSEHPWESFSFLRKILVSFFVFNLFPGFFLWQPWIVEVFVFNLYMFSSSIIWISHLSPPYWSSPDRCWKPLTLSSSFLRLMAIKRKLKVIILERSNHKNRISSPPPLNFWSKIIFKAMTVRGISGFRWVPATHNGTFAIFLADWPSKMIAYWEWY